MNESAQIMIVRKDREKQNDQRTMSEWRDARSIFFTQLIHQKLSEIKATQEEQKQIIRLFLEKQHQIEYQQLKQVAQFKRQIEQLRQSLQQIQQHYQQKQMECLPIQHIIKHNFSTLEVINIYYEPKEGQFKDQFRYSITASELFKVVNTNKLLNQVIIKGVHVQAFQQFTNLLNRVVHNLPIQQAEKESNDFCWMKGFCPSKSLKLSIEGKINFDIQSKEDTLWKINSLAYFEGLFYSLSDITVKINLGEWSETLEEANTLEELLTFLRGFKKIKLQFAAEFIQSQIIGIIRSVLFGNLACFTEITHLSFFDINFDSQQVGINDYLAIEQSLSTVFKNNQIIYLALHRCENLPIFAEISTLQSIYLWKTSFRKQFNFISEAIRSNLSLRIIKYSLMKQQWRIDEKTFNRLETLTIRFCNHIFIGNISSQSPSNLRHLYISNSNIGKADVLAAIFPKLVNLTLLSLSYIDFGHQLLSMIPSSQLQELHLFANHEITDQDVELIDRSWPQLSNITISNCSKLTSKLWNFCKFKGLMQLRVKKRILQDNKTLKYLKGRGIKVDID